ISNPSESALPVTVEKVSLRTFIPILTFKIINILIPLTNMIITRHDCCCTNAILAVSSGSQTMISIFSVPLNNLTNFTTTGTLDKMDAPKVSLDDIGMSLRRFGVADYVVFVLMLVICALIGVYYGFFAGKSQTAADYLMGGRNMQTFPVALSLIASFISGITLLGVPTEIYLYGTQYLYCIFTVLCMGVAVSTAYLPVFHDLKLTSTYEVIISLVLIYYNYYNLLLFSFYLERRFNKKVRLFGSFLIVVCYIHTKIVYFFFVLFYYYCCMFFSFFFFQMLWLPIVIYVPALAFNQVTGINVHIITPAVCIVCIFYTCVGGLKAVVWTDVVQTLIMFAAMILVMVKGTIDIGGLGVVWNRNYDSGRIEAPNFSPDPTVRHSILTLLVGGFFWWLQVNAVNQNMIQRYLTLPNMHLARIALAIFVVGAITFLSVCGYCGLLIFATYYDCDPLTTKLASAKDQLLPLLVMDTLKGLPGLPGLFVAGVFSAALSSLSTGLNSMAAVLLEDFCKIFLKSRMNARRTNIFLKTVVVVLGAICVALVFVVEKLGAVLQMSMSLSGMSNGPSLGLFSMGTLSETVEGKGAFIGGIGGLGFMTWITLGTQAAIAAGDISFETKPLTVDGCKYDFGTASSMSAVVNSTVPLHKGEVFILYQMSYLWYTLLGAVVSMLIGLVASFLTTPINPASIDRMLVSPVIRRFLPKKQNLQDNTLKNHKCKKSRDMIYANKNCWRAFCALWHDNTHPAQGYRGMVRPNNCAYSSVQIVASSS
ncbi:hypothetical protein L9F63_026809, partial [Diploptera punctata]